MIKKICIIITTIILLIALAWFMNGCGYRLITNKAYDNLAAQASSNSLFDVNDPNTQLAMYKVLQEENTKLQTDLKKLEIITKPLIYFTGIAAGVMFLSIAAGGVLLVFGRKLLACIAFALAGSCVLSIFILNTQIEKAEQLATLGLWVIGAFVVFAIGVFVFVCSLRIAKLWKKTTVAVVKGNEEFKKTLNPAEIAVFKAQQNIAQGSIIPPKTDTATTENRSAVTQEVDKIRGKIKKENA